MTEYMVQVKEVIVHTVYVEAASKDAACEMARDLLTDVSADELEVTNGYFVEAEGFLNQDYVEEN